MTAYWLTYKPLTSSSPRGWPPAEMEKLVRTFELDPASATPLWRIAAFKTAMVGDRVYLFKQGSDPRGIFGVGEIIEPPRVLFDPTDTDVEPTERIKIRLLHLVDPAKSFILEYDEIADLLPKSLVNAQASGKGVPPEVERELEKRLSSALGGWGPLRADEADDLEFDPDSITDERERALRAIRVRRGQSRFRMALMAAYGGKCAITGCAVEDVLEAAHITPYLGKLTNHVSNGLLLRTDLHTLFDCGLIAIEPSARSVVVARSLKGSSYAKLAGVVLRSCQNVANGPSRRNLELRFAAFRDLNIVE